MTNFNVREVIIGTYRNEKKDYLLPDTRQPHKGLEMFLQTDLNFELAESILEYTRYLNEIDKKKRQLEADAKQRGIPQPKILRSELELLQHKMKKMSDNYGKLLLMYKSIGSTIEG